MSDFKLQKILIAIEDSPYSDKASSYGFELAKKIGAAVAIVHVNDVAIGTPYIADPLLNEPPIMVPEMMQLQEEASNNLLNKVSQAHAHDGLSVFTFTKLGDPKTEILATAEEWEADLIILGTHGRTGLDHFISGSVAESVARHAKCPVLIIPKKHE